MKLKYSGDALLYSLVLIMIIQGNLFIKLGAIFLLLVFNRYKLFPSKTRQPAFFYLFVLTVIIFSFLTIGWLHHFKYIYSLLFSFIIWFFCYFLFVFNDQYINAHPLNSLRESIDIVFGINIIVSLTQLIVLMIGQGTINPFAGSYKGATGDFIYGIFPNSSINMIMCTFFFFYYMYQKKKWSTFFAVAVGIFTTYMSGIVLAVVAFVIILLFNPAIKFKYKLYGFIFLVAAYFSFRIISPENVKYTEYFLKKTFSLNPPRKLISFKETADYTTSTIPRFLMGSGPGNFSSRTTFVFGGEYVSWLPQQMVYRSEAFANNHFQLWNNEILSIPYNDGTANQPFSVYNQLLGEYGWIGVLIFLIFYTGYYFKYYYRLTYGKYLLVFLLLIFLMDYWFEYISVVVLFEILMLVQLKELKEKNQPASPKSIS